MKLFKQGEIEFFMRTIVFSLMLMALLHAFKPYFSDSEAGSPTREEIEALAAKTKLMTSDEVASHLKKTGKPTMLVIYASWCTYCKQAMPMLHDLWREKKIPSGQLLALSVDKEITALSDYILRHEMQDMLAQPVALRIQKEAPLSAALQPLYSAYSGGIPYIGVFGADGIALDEVNGVPERAEFERLAARLK